MVVGDPTALISAALRNIAVAIAGVRAVFRVHVIIEPAEDQVWVTAEALCQHIDIDRHPDLCGAGPGLVREVRECAVIAPVDLRQQALIRRDLRHRSPLRLAAG